MYTIVVCDLVHQNSRYSYLVDTPSIKQTTQLTTYTYLLAHAHMYMRQLGGYVRKYNVSCLGYTLVDLFEARKVADLIPDGGY
jgi:hypothetical protein